MATKESAKKKISAGKNTEVKNAQKPTPVQQKKKPPRGIETFDGQKITIPESKFIDEYIKTGNGQQSYLAAYPKTKPSAASSLANRLLKREKIANEIEHRMAEATTESIASANEVMQYFTDVMQGKLKDAFGLEASLSERTKAAVELAKRLIDIPSKATNQETTELKITLDWARPAEVQTVEKVLAGAVAELNSAESQNAELNSAENEEEGKDE